MVDIAKARAIASRLASDHDGEVIAAARALVRLAKAAGIRVEDLIGSSPALTPQPKPRQQEQQYNDARMREAAEAFMRAAAASSAFADTVFGGRTRPGRYDSTYIEWGRLMAAIDVELRVGPNHPKLSEQERLTLVKVFNTYLLFERVPALGPERDVIIDLLIRLGILGKP